MISFRFHPVTLSDISRRQYQLLVVKNQKIKQTEGNFLGMSDSDAIVDCTEPSCHGMNDVMVAAFFVGVVVVVGGGISFPATMDLKNLF